MSSLSNISITHTFSGDTSASNKVDASELDTQLGNLATAQNQTKAALDTVLDGSNNLAAQTVGLSQLKPEVATEIGSLAWLSATATYDPPSLTAGTSATTTVTLSGAALGDTLAYSFSLNLQSVDMTAWVSAINTVTVKFSNRTAGTVDLGSGTIKVMSMRFG